MLPPSGVKTADDDDEHVHMHQVIDIIGEDLVGRVSKSIQLTCPHASGNRYL